MAKILGFLKGEFVEKMIRAPFWIDALNARKKIFGIARKNLYVLLTDLHSQTKQASIKIRFIVISLNIKGFPLTKPKIRQYS